MSERELNYPIYYYHKDGSQNGVVTKREGNRVHVGVTMSDGYTTDTITGFTNENVKDLIKRGMWVVTHSGSTTEAPTSPSKDIAHLTIKIDAEAATEAVKALTDALHKCAEAYKYLRNVMEK